MTVKGDWKRKVLVSQKQIDLQAELRQKDLPHARRIEILKELQEFFPSLKAQVDAEESAKKTGKEEAVKRV